jgi:excisionase family DNA binding protein
MTRRRIGVSTSAAGGATPRRLFHFPTGGTPMNLTVRDAARRLGVSPGLVYDWCRRHLLTHFRFARPGRRGKILIPEDALAAFVEQFKVSPETAPPPVRLKHIRQ